MRNFKNSFFYIVIIGGFSAVMYWIITKGKSLETGRNIVAKTVENGHWKDFIDSMAHNLQHPLAILLAQIVTIILVARFFGWVSRKIGQPSVIGEIIAGIVLGPSLVGMYWPEFSGMLFPKESLGNLQFLSQIGLILFMFVIGMELDLKALKNKAHDAVVISHASIIIPFSLGVGLAFFIYTQFAPKGVEFASFGLFLGIAMSITAFPVLARIVQERGLQKTKLGTIAITCAAADDITAWCILAAVIAIVKAGSFVSSLYVIALALIYVLVMLKVVRPFLKRVGDLKSTRESLSKPVVAIFFLTLLLSSYASELIGIHALFGAFMAGAIMPENSRFRNIFIEKVEDVSVVILLPLFFVFTGLRTQIGLLNDPYLWKITGLIIFVGVAGKFFGSMIAAKFVGQSWKDSLSIGALMNTRGLMELVVLNIGYDLGVLSTEIFTMMVIMALVTTFMTGPALDLINYIFKDKQTIIPEEISSKSKYKILLSFGAPDKGKILLKVANSLVKKQSSNTAITAMHLSLSSELHSFDVKDYERDIFEPVVSESEHLDQKIHTLFKASSDINSDIVETANQGEYDLLLVGLGQSIFEGTLLGKVLGLTTRIINPDRLIDKFTGKEGLFENSPFDERTRQIVTKSKMAVGILVDKNLDDINKVFMPIFSEEDAFLIEYAQKLIHNNGSQIVVLDAVGQIKSNAQIRESIRSIEQTAPNHIMVTNEKTIKKEFLDDQDLMLISLESWKKLIDSHSIWLNNTPSVLIIKP
ncbi:cation/H(+) antiporter [Flavobacterium noncentrifugens]|uniref:Kef-type K+ transport system, membrane component KefB n=1 Tax=Flavobacterium noncentrifugens TaxID=1128970 RepID=A0A1G9AMF0_9FLAO|nr:cation:proton antiporter [Flavobacterium noncentrifugens]GEP51493.1 cation/H(+) antiporter [Flavobacterium noncentrifugens]SDK27984.1 Kef-type K+ transport system, membrane component KefB [Flavobacterium noncentrifugens]